MQATRTWVHARVRQMVADGIGCKTERGAGARDRDHRASQRRIDDHKPWMASSAHAAARWKAE